MEEKIQNEGKLKTIIFADNFNIRIVAEAIHLPNAKNIESYLNIPNNEEVILEGAEVYERVFKKGYNFLSKEDAQAIKTSHIVMVCGGNKDLIYTPEQGIGKTFKLPVKFRLEGLERGLIGGIVLSGDEEEIKKLEDIEKLKYLTKQLKDQKFIKFYKPHQRPGQYSFIDLFKFKGTKFDRELLQKKLDIVLLNRTNYSVYTTSIFK